MFKLNLDLISNIVNGKLIGDNKLIENISINSRIIKKNCLFITYKGKNFDSFEFISNAIDNGAIAIITSKFIKRDISQIIVDNVNDSLLHIAKFIRNKYKACVIAITGSCGKTSIKEMLVKILSKLGKVSYTKENQNNILGVILTILNIDEKDKFLIVEIGTDTLIEIYKSSSLVKPNIILINNLYISHFEKLKSWINLSIAKGEIIEGYKNFYRLILNYDSNNWNYWRFLSFYKEPLFFSMRKIKNVDFYPENIKINLFSSEFKLNLFKSKIKLNLPGRNNISNAVAASSIALSLGSNIKHIKLGLSKFKPIDRRLKPIFINSNKIILDDTYNANLGSFISSVKFLDEIDSSYYKLLVIGNIYELGNSEIFLHKFMGNIIKPLKIDKIFSIGNLAFYITYKNLCGQHFYDKNNLLNEILKLIIDNKKISVLIKGSRKNKLDEIIYELLNKIKNDKIFS